MKKPKLLPEGLYSMSVRPMFRGIPLKVIENVGVDILDELERFLRTYAMIPPQQEVIAKAALEILRLRGKRR